MGGLAPARPRPQRGEWANHSLFPTELGEQRVKIGANNKSNFELHNVGLPITKTTTKLRATIQNIDQVEAALNGTKWIQELDLPVLEGGE